MMPLRSHIPHLQGDSACQLTLKIEVVILHVRCTDVTIKSENVTFQLTAPRCIKDRLPRRDRSTGVHGRNDLRRPNWIVSRTRIVIRRVGGGGPEKIL